MTTEPFFDEFHRLQPDVPVVLLPPAAAAVPDAIEHVDPADAAARAAAARRAAGGLLHAMWPVVGAGAEQPPTTRHGWEPGSPGTVRARAAARVSPPARQHDTVSAARDALAALGWHVTVRTLGAGVRQLVAERDDQAIEVVDSGPDGPLDVVCTVGAVVGEHVLAVRRTGTVETGWGREAPGPVLDAPPAGAAS